MIGSMRVQHTAAAVLPAARGQVTIAPVEVRDPGPGEVLLKMEACGVCHSDLFVAGLEKLPLVPLTLGHEGIGRVEAVGEGVWQFAVGDRAGMTFLGSTCGTCDWCRSGLERFCARQLNHGYTLHGALAGWATAPAAHLVRIPQELNAAEAAPLCCAGWTAFGALREAEVEPGETVALFGFGGVGHLALQIARGRGLRAAVADVSPEKLEMARAAGADITVSADNAGRTLQKEHGGVDAAIVLTANAAAIQQAFRSLKRMGRLVLVGLSTSTYELPLVDTVLKGVTVRGSYLGTASDLEEVFTMARSGILRAHVQLHELAETPSLLEQMRRGQVLGRAVISIC
jgi:propanol-preferring alcohol dehydrogenase